MNANQMMPQMTPEQVIKALRNTVSYDNPNKPDELSQIAADLIKSLISKL